MSAYAHLFGALAGEPRLSLWRERLPTQLRRALGLSVHGDLARWQALVDGLPALVPTSVDLKGDWVRIGASGDAESAQRDAIEAALRGLHPWRKGPFEVFGIRIDTEWRSDLKWRRLEGHITPLQERMVLDVGCGNGYHAWRMVGGGARRVIGIDPTLLSVMQFCAIKHFAGDYPVDVLPVGIDDVPFGLEAFDTVFSMGVLYHRRSPLDHLLELKGCLRSGGELVLETLVVEGECDRVLVPEGRYARMRNVWFIPSCLALEHWLKRCGYRQIRLLDVSKTTREEQRSTDWMRFQSLADFLDPDDPDRTCEGLPAPRRAIFLAEKP